MFNIKSCQSHGIFFLCKYVVKRNDINILAKAYNFFYLVKQTPAVFAEEKHIFAAVHLALYLPNSFPLY
jgi:hypothetical protein